MEKAYELARNNLEKQAERRKNYYNTKTKSKTFKVGEWVLYYYPRRRLAHYYKWQQLYEGPYLVVRQVSAVNFVIQKSERSDPIVVHTDKLKHYFGDTPNSWLEDNLQGEEATAQPAKKLKQGHGGGRRVPTLPAWKRAQT